MGYVCPECGKSSRLPDFCCGRAMAASGSYFCPECGAVASSPGECCSKSMVQL